MKKYKLAIVGATGLVGQTLIKVLEERNFPIDAIYFFASAKSKGKTIIFQDKSYPVEVLSEDSFHREIDIALFSAGGEVSSKYAVIAKARGVVVIDNSSTWRMDAAVPLIVPEVNGKMINAHQGIIANPNCSTIQSVVPLGVLHAKYRIKRLVYSTYQAVSGSGFKGIENLESEIKTGESKNVHPIAYNCIPHIDRFLENGYTKEEMKMIEETQKILADPTIRVTATTVRVPVRYGHSVSINIEFEKAFDLDEVKKALEMSDGVQIIDDVLNQRYPTALSVEGKDDVYVGRIRRDYSLENGLNLWVVADNIRKGAATNAVQIAELVIRSACL